MRLVTTPEFAALSETLDALAKYCASSSRVETLHADALRELTGLVRNLHDRVTRLADAQARLEVRVAVLEGEAG